MSIKNFFLLLTLFALTSELSTAHAETVDDLRSYQLKLGSFYRFKKGDPKDLAAFYKTFKPEEFKDPSKKNILASINHWIEKIQAKSDRNFYFKRLSLIDPEKRTYYKSEASNTPTDPQSKFIKRQRSAKPPRQTRMTNQGLHVAHQALQDAHERALKEINDLKAQLASKGTAPSNIPPPPPLPSGIGAPPPPPPGRLPNLFGSNTPPQGGAGPQRPAGFLAEIAAGTKLKKVDPNQKYDDKKPGFLDELKKRQAGGTQGDGALSIDERLKAAKAAKPQSDEQKRLVELRKGQANLRRAGAPPPPDQSPDKTTSPFPPRRSVKDIDEQLAEQRKQRLAEETKKKEQNIFGTALKNIRRDSQVAEEDDDEDWEAEEN